jgi:hypothetical protein
MGKRLWQALDKKSVEDFRAIRDPVMKNKKFWEKLIAYFPFTTY